MSRRRYSNTKYFKKSRHLGHYPGRGAHAQGISELPCKCFFLSFLRQRKYSNSKVFPLSTQNNLMNRLTTKFYESEINTWIDLLHKMWSSGGAIFLA